MDMNVNTDLLKKLRLDKSWSQEQLAEEAGLSLRTVQRIESEGIAAALDVEPSDLDIVSEAVSAASSSKSKKPERPHTFTPNSMFGYYSWVSLRVLSISLLWTILATNVFFGVSVLFGSIFFWELTLFTAMQSAGSGILAILLVVIPGHFLFLWPYKQAKRMAVVRPLAEGDVEYSNS